MNVEGSLDICIFAVSIHEHRRTLSTEYWKTLPCSSSGSNSEEEIQVSFSDSLEEALVKLSVEQFTKYYELKFKTVEKHGIPYCVEIVSHFKALYYYRAGEYLKLLNACDSILSCLKYPPGCPHQFIQCVSVCSVFQLLFGNDVTCLTGIIALIGWNLLDVNSDYFLRVTEISKTLRVCTFFNDSRFNNKESLGYKRVFLRTNVSCLFLVYYLRFQSLVRLKLSEICHTVSHK